MLRTFALSLAIAAVTANFLRADGPTIQVNVRGRTLEGWPLRSSDDGVHLLGRDGSLWQFTTAEVEDFHKTSDGFQRYSQADVRAQLLREFGQAFDVSGTGHYLVVHPRGKKDLWAERFEDLYRGFIHYFSARGMSPKTPEFPMVAVVFSKEMDFMRYAAREGIPPGGLLGYYSPSSNRIALFDTTTSKSSEDWTTNAETIIHEASHQTAFNTGIHSRYTLPPRWVVEGLGTMFEARGVWDSRKSSRPSDRLNRGRLDGFRKYLARRKPKSLGDFVANDRLFQTDINGAYGQSWALTFFLAETEPRKYQEYLAKTASREHFSEYTSAERLSDFVRIFGSDFVMLETRMLRFIADLK